MTTIPIENKKVLSILIHGAAKSGKSTLTSTVPLPAIVLDAEGSWNFIDEVGFRSGTPLRKIYWNPLTEELPEYDGTWDVCHVTVASWQVMTTCFQALTQYSHSFRSIVIDSITEVQRRCKKNIRGGSQQMQTQQWGQLLDQMDDIIRGFRDLTLLENTITCVAYVAESFVDKKGRDAPYMQGQIGNTMPYWVAICGQLEVEHQLGLDGESTQKIRILTIGPDPTKVTGERVAGRLPDIIEHPNIADMMAAIYPNRED